jgi:proteasome endopeptidase complex, beta component (EC 3.4.25.1). Threonine peptidase. MEROPS family T01A
MSVEAAQQAAVASVEAAAERDTGSGNGVYLATVTEEGVDIQDYDLDEFDT